MHLVAAHQLNSVEIAGAELQVAVLNLGSLHQQRRLFNLQRIQRLAKFLGLRGLQFEALEAARPSRPGAEVQKDEFSFFEQAAAKWRERLQSEMSIAQTQWNELLESALVNGIKNGYAFRYVIVGASNLGAPAKFEVSATPLRYGRTGRRSFFRDASGGLHAADRQGAVGSASDPKAE